MGPSVQILTRPGPDDASPCLLMGTLPPGMVAPLHSHPSGPPSAETVTRFLEIANRYGHWNATPEENAVAGIDLPAMA